MPLDHRIPTPSTPDEPRLRTLPTWVATIVCGVAAAITLALMIIPRPLAAVVTSEPMTESIVTGAIGFLGAVLCFPALALFHGVSPSALFLTRPGRAAFRWGGIGLAIGGTVIGLAALGGWATLSPGELTLSQLAVRVVAGLAVGLWTGTLEEFLMRGIVLSILGHRWSWPGAVVTTAVVFGLLHHAAAETFTATVLYVALTTIAGLLFGIITVTSGSVWNAVFLHAAWNAFFNEFVVAVDGSVGIDPVLVVSVTAHPAVSPGGAALSESPLAVALFVLVLIATVRRIPDSDPSDRSVP